MADTEPESALTTKSVAPSGVEKAGLLAFFFCFASGLHVFNQVIKAGILPTEG